MQFTELPGLGQPLQGGIFCGLTTTPDGAHHAVVLLADKPPTRLDWQAACAWAETVGGALPTRPVAAMLFANAKAKFEEAWHWTADAFGGSYAWVQLFFNGADQAHEDLKELQRVADIIELENQTVALL